MVSNGEDLMARLMSELTIGMNAASAGGVSFNGGPLGDIRGILDSFGLDFNDCITEFMSRYESFRADIQNMSLDRRRLFEARPTTLPRFPSFLQIGSKIPSIQYSSELNEMLWDKLNTAFPNPTFNGVKIANVPSGSTFAATFPRGSFPGKCLMLCIAAVPTRQKLPADPHLLPYSLHS